MFQPPFLKFKRMRPGAIIPSRATDGSGGFDFYAPEDGFLDPGEKQLINSGVAHDMPGELTVRCNISVIADPTGAIGPSGGRMYIPLEVPFKMQGILFDRSGLGGKKGIKLSFHGLIDNDYRGEILLSIKNDSQEAFAWRQGDRLCQIGYALMYSGTVVETTVLDETKRGDGGFGSTGN